MSGTPYIDPNPLNPPRPTDLPPVGDPVSMPGNEPREPDMPTQPPLDVPPPPHEPDDPYPGDVPPLGDPLGPGGPPAGDPPEHLPTITM